MTSASVRTAKTVFYLTVLATVSRVMGFVREQVIAGSFGASATSDAYVTAQTLAFILDTICSGALAATIVPLYTKANAEGKEVSGRFVSTVILVFGMFFVTEAGVLWFSVPMIMTVLVPGLNAETLASASSLGKLFAPTVALLGFTGMIGSILNVRRQFIIPAMAALLANVSVLVVAAVKGGDVSAPLLASAVIAGYVVRLGWLVYTMVKTDVPFSSYLQVDWRLVRTILTLSWPLLVAQAIEQLTPLIDKFFASQLEAGTISALAYAFKLIQLPVGIVIMGFSAVLFTRFSQLWADGDQVAFSREVSQTFRYLLSITVPSAALVAVFARPIVTLVFQRGQFDATATMMTSGALAYYSGGLVAVVIIPVVSRVLFAMQRTRVQMVSGLASLLVYVGLSLLLVGPLGHRGLALAFSISQLVSLMFLGYMVFRRLAPTSLREVWGAIPTAVVSAGLVYGAGWVVRVIVMPPITEVLVGGGLAVCLVVVFHLGTRTQEGLLLLRSSRNLLGRLISAR